MPTKIGILSDIHLHNFNEFGYPYDEHGINQRLHYLVAAIKYHLEVFKKNDVEMVYILGDLVEHCQLDPAVLRAGNEAFADWKGSILGLAGNHDQDTFGNSVLEAFKKIREVNTGIFAPYYRDVTRYRGRFTYPVSFTHADFKGALTSRTIAGEPVLQKGGVESSLLKIRGDYPRVIWSGHYHYHQILSFDEVDTVVVYAGTIAQHNFGEDDLIPGSWIVTSYEYDDMPRLGYETFIETPKLVAPRFYRVNVTDELTVDKLPGNIYSDYYRLATPSVFQDKARKLQAELRHSKIKQVDALKIIERSRIEKHLEKKVVSDPAEVVGVYTKLHAPKDHKTLNAFAADVLEKVRDAKV